MERAVRPLVILLDEEAPTLELKAEQIGLATAETEVVVLQASFRSTYGRIPPAR
ncbi:MAG: hypothetical protein QOJ14_1324 [Thermoleophilaceae bacterium]|nr:hypothetical protein [Thermoleophilaceae bacterium]